MSATTGTIISNTIFALVQIALAHKKPKDWKPTPQDVKDFLEEIDAATPEARKEAARKRLGIS